MHIAPRRGRARPPFNQLLGINDDGVTAGFWSGMNTAAMMNDNFGFYAVNGSFRTADFPAGDPASPPAGQLLGVNDSDVAAGFYTDAKGNTDGFLATPATASVRHLRLQAMPAGTATCDRPVRRADRERHGPGAVHLDQHGHHTRAGRQPPGDPDRRPAGRHRQRAGRAEPRPSRRAS